MTDRALTLTVILEQPTRTDDVEGLITAIKQLRGVEDVQVGVIDGYEQHLAIGRARREIREQIINILYPATRNQSGGSVAD